MIFHEPTLTLSPAGVAMGIDVGYKAVKAACADAGRMQTFSFPSVVAPAADAPLNSSTQLLGNRKSELEIKIGGEAFIVDTCDTEPDSTSVVRTELDDFPRSKEYAALVFAALRSSGFKRFKQLTLGLPLHTFLRHAEFLVHKFRGVHEFGHGEFVVEQLTVIPQPLGAFYAFARNNSVRLDTRTSIAAVDIGYGTTDIFTASASLKPDKERCGGFPGGAALVLREIAAQLQQQYQGRFSNLDRIDRAIVENRPLVHSGAEIDLTPFLQRTQHVTTPICKAIANCLKTTEDLTVLATGGAAHYYLPDLRKTLNCNVEVVENPRFANSIGFCQAAIDACARSAK
ncbi:ParM/StbA family protein [Paraburkholderia mimosarum]|uniref:ParM/StbA family protein n=1 Tax=Paraburkholderia mimosarum TaxID=312026 RepID=UPI0012B5359F|nr:ParM/StbA family protein [Paraburkholderia mimosarum]